MGCGFFGSYISNEAQIADNSISANKLQLIDEYSASYDDFRYGAIPDFNSDIWDEELSEIHTGDTGITYSEDGHSATMTLIPADMLTGGYVALHLPLRNVNFTIPPIDMLRGFFINFETSGLESNGCNVIVQLVDVNNQIVCDEVYFIDGDMSNVGAMISISPDVIQTLIMDGKIAFCDSLRIVLQPAQT